MSFTYVFQSDLDAAAAQKIITEDQANALWPYLQQQDNDRWQIGWSRLAYVIGGFLIIGSLTWFTSLVWEQHTLALFWLTLFYIATFGFAGNYFWKLGQGWQQIVGGVFVTVAVCVSPVSVYSLEKYYNFFTPVTPGVLPATTLAVSSIIALIAVPFTFLTAPLSFALYYISIRDIPPLIWGGYSSLEEQSWVSVVFGVAMIGAYRIVDAFKPKYDYAFWGYLYGVASLVGGLTTLDTYVYTSWEFKLAYFFINLGLAASGNLFNRVVFVIFGGFGVTFATVDFFVTYATVEQDAWLSVSFGGVLMAIGFVIENRKTPSGLPYWFYLVGVPTFWFGWATLFGWPIYVSFGFRFLFFLVNLGLLLGLIYTKERIFLFFGGAGVLWYVEALAEMYPNAWWLPLVITLLGLGFIALAVYYSGKGVAALVRKIKKQKIADKKARKKAADLESTEDDSTSSFNQMEMHAIPSQLPQEQQPQLVLQQLPGLDMQGQPMMVINYVPMGSYDPSMYVPMVPATTDSA